MENLGLNISLGTGVRLCPIKLDKKYATEWNENKSDFLVLTKDGNWINNCLYRVSGFRQPDIQKDKYFLLIKYVEAYYPEHMIGTKNKKYLESRWCIIDNNGTERKVFEPFKCPYLIKNTPVYSVDNHYYNIETGEYYGYSIGYMMSDEYMFLDLSHSEYEERRGILKISLKNSASELFKKTK